MPAAWWVVLPLAWLIGTVPFSYLLPRWFSGRDVRSTGSGNVGATNAARAAGKLVGACCLLLDASKGALVILLAEAWAAPLPVVVAAALLALTGHGHSPWLQGAGGKGVATTAGALLALSTAGAAVVLVVWVVLLATTRTVSVASIGAAAAMPLALLLGNLGLAPWSVSLPVVLFGGVAGPWIIFRHKDNLKRLRAGQEPRIGTVQS